MWTLDLRKQLFSFCNKDFPILSGVGTEDNPIVLGTDAWVSSEYEILEAILASEWILLWEVTKQEMVQKEGRTYDILTVQIQTSDIPPSLRWNIPAPTRKRYTPG